MKPHAGRNSPRPSPSSMAGRSPKGNMVSLTVAAETLGISTKTVRRRIADGTVRGYRVGRLIRLDLDEVREALAVVIPSAG
ncbi:excisionase family DNA-binding protein [Promicromonospora thailandica]|uniref:excisionase family DNA-binding protein n=1 Tax=Promicromonospora thailandica TaxID=765201 RepID=UPI0027E2CAA9|nr:excisionase family DNA-binding protein [Promicromonospora thailandica]